MRLSDLQYLIAINDYHNITAASKHLYLTPQALSMSMARLEKELNLKLISTSNKGTNLTNSGVLLAKEAMKFLNALDEIQKSSTYQTSSSRGHTVLNVLASFGMQEFIFPDIFSDIKHSLPHMSLDVSYAKARHFFDYFANDASFDIAIYYNMILKNKTFVNIPQSISLHNLSISEMYCIAHKEGPLARYKTISLKTIHNLSLTIVCDVQFNILQDLFNESGIFSQVQYENNAAFVYQALKNRNCITFGMVSSHNSLLRNIPENCFALKINDDLNML